MKNLAEVFTKDLKRLYAEIDAYTNEDELWVKANGISNTGGNLAMHIVGNLNSFIGKNLGNTGYIRNRNYEFEGIISKKQLLDSIFEVSTIVDKIISNLPASELTKTYPENVFGSEMETSYFLFHLLGHLNYHLGQINYHRRIVCYK